METNNIMKVSYKDTAILNKIITEIKYEKFQKDFQKRMSEIKEKYK